MNNLNSVLIEGNLVRDPLLRQTPQGASVCNLSIVNNRFCMKQGKMEKEVHFFDIEAWRKLAESCREQGRKGCGVRIVGRLKQDRWNDNNGKPHSKVSIFAEHVEFRSEEDATVQDFETEAAPTTNDAQRRLEEMTPEKLFELWADFGDEESPDAVEKIIELKELGAGDAMSFRAFFVGFQRAAGLIKEV